MLKAKISTYGIVTHDHYVNDDYSSDGGEKKHKIPTQLKH